ncbi:MAG: hypothetical protein R3D55_11390 [Chloroflexota bacterium]
MLAVILLPIDIAVRRLVITKRDWERAWAATFGRLQPAAAAPAPRTEQVSRLFEAKQRAGQEAAQKPSEEAKPAVILRKEEGGNEERPSATQPAPSIKKPQKTAESGTLAARLLQKKQQQDPDA